MLRINKSLTEEDLIEGCRKGKASAQRRLYDRLAPKMLGVCVRYIKDREEAEHVMIGGIVKVFDKLDQSNRIILYIQKHAHTSVKNIFTLKTTKYRMAKNF